MDSAAGSWYTRLLPVGAPSPPTVLLHTTPDTVNDKAALLRQKADSIRRSVVEVAIKGGAGHIAPSLSCVDILVALYYDVMRGGPGSADRDRLILSKGHGCYGLYAILADLGVIPEKEWRAYYTPESTLCGCLERRPEYGIEASTGALGHGLPMAVGLAFGARFQRKAYRTFCIVGDGELQEGTSWEALQFAVKHALAGLTIIVDNNGLQAMDFITNVLDRNAGDLVSRLEGFGLEPVRCDGHDMAALIEVLRSCAPSRSGIPSVVVARTVKGYGLKCMENVPRFHFRIPSEEELEQGWRP